MDWVLAFLFRLARAGVSLRGRLGSKVPPPRLTIDQARTQIADAIRRALMGLGREKAPQWRVSQLARVAAAATEQVRAAGLPVRTSFVLSLESGNLKVMVTLVEQRPRASKVAQMSFWRAALRRCRSCEGSGIAANASTLLADCVACDGTGTRSDPWRPPRRVG